VAIAVILPIANQRMIMAVHFEWQIVRKQFNDGKELFIKRNPVPAFLLAPVVAFELSGPFNRRH
jgi:hypothetical protein